jgi:hypothetical protein
MPNEKTGKRGRCEVERCSPRKQILSILCRTKMPFDVPYGPPITLDRAEALIVMRRWQRRRSGIGR